MRTAAAAAAVALTGALVSMGARRGNG
jgi:hypothetical protein